MLTAAGASYDHGRNHDRDDALAGFLFRRDPGDYVRRCLKETCGDLARDRQGGHRARHDS